MSEICLTSFNDEYGVCRKTGVKGVDPFLKAKARPTLAAPMAEPRRLRGHKATATCCIASVDRPGLVATSGEGMKILFTFPQEMKSRGLAVIIHVLSTAIMKATSWKPLESYNYNKEEINQIVSNSKSAFVAAADDGGDVKV
ncbi:hypothetical protein RJ639_024685 [Escallonia herrerae]|uniref:Uncharacterized protein n=1 Tax=Escallonia herrerae TaxID=1293975 RepID=A0AA88V0Y0_9ASTE|nr:hypothetical protein RJ639_024685 [Escallonia herrerae]